MELGEDLLLEILSRLDIKSAARMRGVCRSWRRVLSSPSLDRKLKKGPLPWVIRTIVWRDCRSTALWCPFSGKPIESTSLPVGPPGTSSEFVGHFSSNGLVCGTLAGIHGPYGPFSRTLTVGNPLANRWTLLQCVEEVEKIEALDVDVETGIYRVAVLNNRALDPNDEEAGRILQYNSGTGRWVMAEGSITTSLGNCSPGYTYNEGDEDCFYDMETLTWTMDRPRESPVEDFEDHSITEPEEACHNWPIRGFSYQGRRILVVHRQGTINGDRHVALSILEKDEKQHRWFPLFRGRVWDIVGEPWPRNGDSECDDWVAHLAGDVIVLSSCIWPPLAFHLVEMKWEVGLWDQEVGFYADRGATIRASYTFVPSLASHP